MAALGFLVYLLIADPPKAMAGNLVNFDEASRALFADDITRLRSLMVDWPIDVREHAVKLAFGENRAE